MTLGEDSLHVAQVRRNFSRHVDDYDRYAVVQKEVAKKLLCCMPAATGLGRVLEVGCGTGLLSREFLHRYPAADLLLSDLAHGMSSKVAREFSACSVVDADAADLPFAAASFDLIISSSVYQWVDHLAQAFAELSRVLRPGGQVVLALFGEQTLFELRQSHAEALPEGVSHSQGFPDCRQIQAALNDTLELELLESQLEIEWHAQVPDLLRSLKAIGAQNASRKRPGGLASRQMMQRMYEVYEQRFGQGGRIPATYEVIYLRLRKT